MGLGAQLGDSGVVLGDFAGSKTLLGSSWFRFFPAVQFGFDFESLWGSSEGVFWMLPGGRSGTSWDSLQLLKSRLGVLDALVPVPNR